MNKNFNETTFFSMLIIYTLLVLLVNHVGLLLGESAKYIAALGVGLLFFASFENTENYDKAKLGEKR